MESRALDPKASDVGMWARKEALSRCQIVCRRARCCPVSPVEVSTCHCPPADRHRDLPGAVCVNPPACQEAPVAVQRDRNARRLMRMNMRLAAAGLEPARSPQRVLGCECG